MELDFFFFAIAIPTVIYAGIDKAGFGSSASVAATAFLTLILDPADAIAIMLPLLLVMDFVALKPNWRRWDARISRILVIGALMGGLLGAGLIFVISDGVFRLIIGLIALGFVAFQIIRRAGLLPTQKPFSDTLGYLFGTGAGITSFVAHAGGPVATIYLLSQNLTKEAYQATTIITFWISNLFKVVLYAALGLFSWQSSLASLYLLPFAIIGTLLGVYVNRVVPEKVYFTLIYVFLTIAGTKLILDALSNLSSG